MTAKQATKLYIGLGIIVLLLLLLPTGLSAQEGAKAQVTPTRVRPTVIPGGNDIASADTGGAEVNTNNCATVQGSAIHWGVGNIGGVGLQLYNAGWQIQQATSDDGRYQMGALGVGVGILEINTGLTDLTPMIDNAVIRLSCDHATFAHIGLYGGDDRPTPPGNLTMRVSPEVAAVGDTVDFRLTVNNTLPNPISQIVVTDLFPEGLRIVNASTTAGSVEVLDDRLLTVAIESIAQNETATISVLAEVLDIGVVDIPLENTATLFYAESAADQASSWVTIQTDVADTLVASADESADESAADEAAPDTLSTQNVAEQVVIAEFDAPPDFLPNTGLDPFTVWFVPFIGFMIILLLTKGLSEIRRRPE
ncbi:MAG: DUF11 domain-containing protein [Chloroflexota bacterium]